MYIPLRPSGNYHTAARCAAARWARWCLPVLFAALLLPAVFAAGSGRPVVDVIRLQNDVISPVTARYILRHLEDAENDGAECLILVLNTPGGLLQSTKEITDRFMNCNVPVITYVAPQGASAASAGVFITMASHIAAMAPGTSIGAAHPVSSGGGTVSEKVNQKWENYASKYVMAIARDRGRNADWAARSVTESAAATVDEAVRLHVVEFEAKNMADLLRKLDGRRVRLPNRTVTLHTAGAETRELPMDWKEDLLSRLAHPNVAYVLFLLAIYGLINEFAHPGTVVPGIIGSICLILALFALGNLPINYAGLSLIILGVVLMVLDIKAPTHGILTAGGAVAMVLGSMMLIDAPDSSLRVSLPIIFGMVGGMTAFFFFAVGYGIRAQQLRVTTGREGMIGLLGRAHSDLAPEGVVFVRGEFWNSRVAGEHAIPAGTRVRVTAVDRTTLIVEPTAPAREQTAT